MPTQPSLPTTAGDTTAPAAIPAAAVARATWSRTGRGAEETCAQSQGTGITHHGDGEPRPGTPCITPCTQPAQRASPSQQLPITVLQKPLHEASGHGSWPGTLSKSLPCFTRAVPCYPADRCPYLEWSPRISSRLFISFSFFPAHSSCCPHLHPPHTFTLAWQHLPSLGTQHLSLWLLLWLTPAASHQPPSRSAVLPVLSPADVLPTPGTFQPCSWQGTGAYLERFQKASMPSVLQFVLLGPQPQHGLGVPVELVVQVVQQGGTRSVLGSDRRLSRGRPRARGCPPARAAGECWPGSVPGRAVWVKWREPSAPHCTPPSLRTGHRRVVGGGSGWYGVLQGAIGQFGVARGGRQ